jgi:hypothetical protein
MPIEYIEHQFSNLGFIKVKFSDQELQPLFEEIKQLEITNFKNAVPFNKELAGNIEKEFELFESKKQVESLIMPFCIEYNKIHRYTDQFAGLTSSVPLVLDNLWVNFQKKNEFNPVHYHEGVYSFVLWIDIPYDITDEISMPSSTESNSKFPAHFQFLSFLRIVLERGCHAFLSHSQADIHYWHPTLKAGQLS